MNRGPGGYPGTTEKHRGLLLTLEGQGAWLFGSVLRSGFGPRSDVDVLLSFAADAAWGLSDLAEMAEELSNLFGRSVDLVEKEGLRNPFKQHSILSTRDVIYAA